MAPFATRAGTLPSGSKNHGHLTANQVHHKRRQALKMSLGPPDIRSLHFLSFGKPGLLQAMMECTQPISGDPTGPESAGPPITGIAACCARAASGHAAALGSSDMNSRRLMCSPQAEDNTLPHRGKSRVVHHSNFGPPDSPHGSFASKAVEAVRPCTSDTPPKADVNSPSWLPPLSAITGCEQSQQDNPLFDHLVGNGEQ